MTGAEHHEEAVQLLEDAFDGPKETRAEQIAAAQVHALLALAAATAGRWTEEAATRQGGSPTR